MFRVLEGLSQPLDRVSIQFLQGSELREREQGLLRCQRGTRLCLPGTTLHAVVIFFLFVRGRSDYRRETLVIAVESIFSLLLRVVQEA